MTEILVILLIILLFFGARRIPEIAGSFGKGIKEFKKSLNEVERSIREPEREESERVRPGDTIPAEPARKADAASEREPKRLLG
jgi:sec-independent protein translocase protein TatA